MKVDAEPGFKNEFWMETPIILDKKTRSKMIIISYETAVRQSLPDILTGKIQTSHQVMLCQLFKI